MHIFILHDSLRDYISEFVCFATFTFGKDQEQTSDDNF